MARKSRKHQHVALVQASNLNTVGYIRLSVSNTNKSHSIENQKLIIGQWGEQHQIPIARFYVDDGYSGTSFNRPAFREMTQDIRSGKIGCVVVKDLSRLGRDYQKTYTSDFLTGKRGKNVGQLDTYLVENAHEPIIDRKTFELVQRMKGNIKKHGG